MGSDLRELEKAILGNWLRAGARISKMDEASLFLLVKSQNEKVRILVARHGRSEQANHLLSKDSSEKVRKSARHRKRWVGFRTRNSEISILLFLVAVFSLIVK